MAAKIIVAASVTADGVMQAPAGPDEDRTYGFAHGGWMTPYVDEGFGDAMGAVFAGADAMLLGHRSYNILAGYWPVHRDEEGAEQLNRMRKYVATRRDFPPEWENTQVLAGEAAETVAALKASSDERIVVQGSSELLRTLQHAKLVDEYHLLVFPVVLGEGKRLFGEGAAPAALRLTRVQTTPSGVVWTAYEYAGPPSC